MFCLEEREDGWWVIGGDGGGRGQREEVGGRVEKWPKQCMHM
jgi:hypothetical protein